MLINQSIIPKLYTNTSLQLIAGCDQTKCLVQLAIHPAWEQTQVNLYLFKYLHNLLGTYKRQNFLPRAFRLLDARKSSNFTNHGDSCQERKYIPQVIIKAKAEYTAANT